MSLKSLNEIEKKIIGSTLKMQNKQTEEEQKNCW